MQVRGGRVTEGLAHLDAAVAPIDHVDFDLRYSILLNRGTTHLFRGDLRTARDDLTAAVTVARAQNRPNEAAKAQHNLGYLEFLAGNLALALQIMDEVMHLATDASAAVILLDRSRVLIEAGLHREADAALREAGELFRADRLFKDLGEVELARAECALLDGRDRRRPPAGRQRPNPVPPAGQRPLASRCRAAAAAGRPGRGTSGPAARAGRVPAGRGVSRPSRSTTQARTAQLIAAEALLQAGRPDRGRRRRPRGRPGTVGRSDLGPAADPAGARPAVLPPMEIRPPREGRSGPAWMSWPATRRASAASTCRPPARCTAGRWSSCM